MKYGVGKNRFTAVHPEKDTQVMLITLAFLMVFRRLVTVSLLLPIPLCDKDTATSFTAFYS